MSNVPRELFIDFGGHAFSGGFSTPHEKIHELEKELLKAYNKMEKTGESELLIVDKKLAIEDVNWDTYTILGKLAPFGQENEKPLFLFEKIQIKDAKNFGKEKNHLQIDFEKDFGGKVSAIGFFKTVDDFNGKLKKDNKIDLIATIEKSTFGRSPELRLRIVEII